MNAKDKIILVERAQSVDELAQYEQGETRKTVLAAIERRVESLINAEYRAGRADG